MTLKVIKGHIEDLTEMAKLIQMVIEKMTGRKAGFAVCFTLSPEYKDCHWVSNLERNDSISLFRDTADKMENEAKQKIN